ncbi:MAG: nucleotidyltransferase substrate binding protein [Candidatus Vogelbacteria bacterium]|nr:nucleotidyltransferase substrate binding protein [Candidatus Vogelbacteria bacterium]
MSKFKLLLEDYQKAVARLDEVLREPKSDIVRDSAIQRFEITFELAWKTIKAYLEEYQKVRCASPRSCFRELFNQGVIDYNDHWLKLADWRNATAHMYNESLADELYQELPKALEKFKVLIQKLKENYE